MMTKEEAIERLIKQTDQLSKMLDNPLITEEHLDRIEKILERQDKIISKIEEKDIDN